MVCDRKYINNICFFVLLNVFVMIKLLKKILLFLFLVWIVGI